MKLFISIFVLGLLIPLPLKAWDNEEAFRNQLKIARSSVANMRARVAGSEKEVVAKAKPVVVLETKITTLNGQIKNIDKLIQIKLRAKELVSKQLKRKIKQLEQQLQKANDEGRDGDLVPIQRRRMAYERTLRDTLARYGYEKQIAMLQQNRRRLEASIKATSEALREPNALLAEARKFLEMERNTLAKAEDKLNTLLKEAPEKLKKVYPSHLASVTVVGKNGTVYKAHWNEATLRLDQGIRELEDAIVEQQRELIKHRGRMDELTAMVLAQNKVCDQRMKEYREALYWQAFETTYVEAVSSAVNIACDFKSMGPYAFVLEAADVTQKSLRGKLTANYGLPKGAFAPRNFGDTFKKVGVSKYKDKFGPKNYIKGTIKNTILQLHGGKEVSKGVSRSLGKEWAAGTMKHQAALTTKITSVAQLKHVLRGKHLLRQTGQAALKEGLATAKLLNPKNFAAATLKNIGKQLKPGEFGRMGVKIVAGVVKEYAKDASQQKRLKVWYRYVEADAVRAAYMKNFRAVAHIRNFDRYTLEIMQELMKELIDERDNAKQLRDQMVTVDEKIEQGETYQVELEFSNRDIGVSSVKIGELEVKRSSVNGAFWKGEITLELLPSSGQMTIIAKDTDTNKIIDDPTTKVSFNSQKATWNHYEPGPDKYHRLRLGEKKAKRSFVFLIDCSGSMGEKTGRMEKAITAANTMLDSGKFTEEDEIALWIFRGGYIQNPVGFTQDHSRVKKAINGLTPSGGTPLAAAIIQSGSYLYSQGRGKYKALIILTDGEATGVDNAIRNIRRMSSKIKIKMQ